MNKYNHKIVFYDFQPKLELDIYIYIYLLIVYE